MKHCDNPRWFYLLVAFAGMLWAKSLPAQEAAPPPRPGNVFTRILKNDYESPQVQALEPRSEQALADRIREGRLELSAEEAIQLALENNVDINVLRYSPYFSLWGIEGGRAALNPTLSFDTNVNRLVTPSTSALQGGTTLLNLTNLYNLSFHKPFAGGLDLDIAYSTTRLRTSSYFNSLNPSITTGLSIGFTQHLLKDFGKISRTRFLAIARNNYDMSLESFIAGTTTIINNVLNSYWSLVYNSEDLRVKEASLSLAQTVLEQTRIQEQVGAMAPLDVLQAEAEVASRNQQVVAARNSRKLLENQFKKLIFPQTDPGQIAASIVPTSRPDPPPPPGIDASQAIQRALEIRPEVKQQLINQRNNQIQVDYTRNQLRPTLDFKAGYSQNGLGGNTIMRDYSNGIFGAPIVGVEPGGFGDSLSSLFGGQNLGYAFGLTFRIPIGNDQARVSNAQAKILYNQGEESLRALRQQIALDVRQAYDALELNRTSVEAAEVTVRYQQRRLQGEQDKYMLGASTTRFVLEAQRDLQNAQSVLLQARIAWIASRIALDKAVGDTFAAHNILLQDALRLPVR